MRLLYNKRREKTTANRVRGGWIARGETTVFNYVHPNNEAIIALLNLIEIRKPYAGETVTGKMRVGDNEFDY